MILELEMRKNDHVARAFAGLIWEVYTVCPWCVNDGPLCHPSGSQAPHLENFGYTSTYLQYSLTDKLARNFVTKWWWKFLPCRRCVFTLPCEML